MAVAGGLFPRSLGARDSGARCHFFAGSARLVRTTDDFIFLPRWATRIPRVDDARIVVRLRDRLGFFPSINDAARPAGRALRDSLWKLNLETNISRLLNFAIRAAYVRECGRMAPRTDSNRRPTD
jgi:hypothetical protein